MSFSTIYLRALARSIYGPCSQPVFALASLIILPSSSSLVGLPLRPPSLNSALSHECTTPTDAVPRAFIIRCSAKKAINPGRQMQLVKDWMRHAKGVCFRQQERRVRDWHADPQPERHHGQKTLAPVPSSNLRQYNRQPEGTEGNLRVVWGDRQASSPIRLPGPVQADAEGCRRFHHRCRRSSTLRHLPGH
jgi:hypothetical protein